MKFKLTSGDSTFSFEGELQEAQALLDAYWKPQQKAQRVAPEPLAVDDETNSEAPKTHQRPEKRASKRKASGTKALKIIDNLFNEDERAKLREFYAEKAPKSQPDMIATLCVKMEELLKRDRFSPDEVYTAIQAVDEKTPGNITGTFNNMISRNKFGFIDDGMFVPNFVCKDHVKHNLPRADTKNG